MATGPETTVDAALTLLGEAVAADGGYSSRAFVEGVRALDLRTAGWLRKDAVLRFPYIGLHDPGRREGRPGPDAGMPLPLLQCPFPN